MRGSGNPRRRRKRSTNGKRRGFAHVDYRRKTRHPWEERDDG